MLICINRAKQCAINKANTYTMNNSISASISSVWNKRKTCKQENILAANFEHCSTSSQEWLEDSSQESKNVSVWCVYGSLEVEGATGGAPCQERRFAWTIGRALRCAGRERKRQKELAIGWDSRCALVSTSQYRSELWCDTTHTHTHTWLVVCDLDLDLESRTHLVQLSSTITKLLASTKLKRLLP